MRSTADTSERFGSAVVAILTPASDDLSDKTLATVDTNAELILLSKAVSLETVSARTFGLSDESQTELT